MVHYVVVDIMEEKSAISIMLTEKSFIIATTNLILLKMKVSHLTLKKQ